MIFDADADDDLPLSKVYISTGCLLVPVFIVVWYYYMKRTFRKFVFRFLKNEAENENSDENGSDSREGSSSMDFSRIEDAYYNNQQNQHEQQHQQRDDVENYSPTVVSDRFVKWVNRRNVFINFQEHQIEKRTKENLFGKNEAAAAAAAETVVCNNGWRVNNNDKYNRDEPITITGDKHDENDDDDSKSTSLFWECIPNTDSHLELCVTTTTDVQVNNNNENENDNASSSSKSTNNKHTGIPYDDNYLIC